MATLPNHLIKLTLHDILENESVYTVPWCMYVDDRELFLNGDYSFRHELDGTATMKVTKLNGEYIVNVSQCKHKWSENGASFVGDFTPIPVAAITEKNNEDDGRWI